MTRTAPMMVDFGHNRHDFSCARLGAMGQSTIAISQATGLTSCQVAYRLQKAGIKRADYRNGGAFFQLVDRSRKVRHAIDGELRRFLY